jgi:hypothetical protein
MRNLFDRLHLTSKAGRERREFQRLEEQRLEDQRLRQAHYRAVTQSDPSGRDKTAE